MGVKQLGEHVLAISANSDYLRGSVGVMLKGLATPVTFTVIPGVDNTDYRVDLRVPGIAPGAAPRSEEHTSELQSLMRISYAVFCLKKKTLSTTQPNPEINFPTYLFS